MARRALRIKDLIPEDAGYLLAVADLPCPLDRAALFHSTGPLEIEVGCGKGMFLRNAAAACPDRCYLGIEVVRRYARYVAGKLARDDCPNAKVVAGDALALFRDKLAAEAVEDVHVYFPDPWWKARHRRRRIVNPDFLSAVERVLMPGGRFHFWTDVKEYFETSLRLIAEHTHLSGPTTPPEQPAWHDLDYRTHFERRVRLNDLPVYRAEFTKPWQTEFTAGAGLPDADDPIP